MHSMGKVHVMRFVVCLSLVFMLLPLLAACSTSAKPHQTYSYTTLSKPTPESDTWHPGDHMRLRWQGKLDSTTIDEAPARIIINAQIIGPFKSMKAINNAVTADGVGVGGPVATSIKPIYTDNWTNQTYTGTLNLPATLSAGYYVLVQSVLITKNDGTVKGSTRLNLKVVPR